MSSSSCRATISSTLSFILGFVCFLLSAAGSLCYSQEVASRESDQPAIAAAPQEIASRALGYIRKEGQRWIDRRECVSCHQIPSMLWSLSSAQANGLPVKKTELSELAAWSTDYLHFVESKDRADAECDDVLEKNTDTMAALLLALPKSKYAQAQTPEAEMLADECGDAPFESHDSQTWRDRFTASLINHQNEDGSWDPRGQLPAQKRDPDETRRVSTLWISLALLREGQDENHFDLESALRFADNNEESDWRAQSAEWWGVRLLVASQLHQTAEIQRIRDAICEQQHDDGGWGWLLEDNSDALATGLVLFSLKSTEGDAIPDEAMVTMQKHAVKQATKFLGDTQLANGSWKVPGTKQNSRNRSVPTSNYWGTAWAVVGLLASPE